MSTTTCPSHDELHAYSIGLLSDEGSDAVAAHLASCAECRTGLSTLDSVEDTFMAQLRRPAVADPYLEESQCQVAVAKAYTLAGNSRESRSKQPFCPKALGEYQLIGELGRGGMGTVYKALHTKLDRVVALKVLSHGRMEDRQSISRFEREMKAVGKISHPNVVQAHDAREIDGMPVLVMEFIDGLDLAEVVRRGGPLPAAEACELVRRTALALQCAHEHGLVHRDIKPSNIMLTTTGDVKLLDLGLARFYAEGGGASPLPAGEEMTGTGRAMGTADYMAPEQAADCHTVDIRADLYSLGCTLYKLLSGRAPFSGRQYPSAMEKIGAHLHQPVPPIRDFAPDVPEELAAILDRLLAKDPDERFAAPADLATAMERFCRGANMADRITRAMASDEPLLSPESPPESSLSHLERVGMRVPSFFLCRPILGRFLIGLGFLGAIGAAFAAGIVITIRRNGETFRVSPPANSRTDFDNQGNLTVTISGEQERATMSNPSAAADLDPLKDPNLFALALQGQWNVVHVEKGSDVPSPFLSGTIELDKIDRFSFQGDLLEMFCLKGGTTFNRYRLHGGATPMKIDFFADTRKMNSPVEASGVCEISGERLTLGIRPALPEARIPSRPASLTDKPTVNDVRITLKRYRPPADEIAVRGCWDIVQETDDGKRMSQGPGFDRICWFYENNAFDINNVEPLENVLGGRYVMQSFVAHASEAKKITITRQQPEKDLFGIYEFQGKQLHIAYRPGGPPPEKFESPPGSGVTLMVLERSKRRTGTGPAEGVGRTNDTDGNIAPHKPAMSDASNSAPASQPDVSVIHPIVRQVTRSAEFTGSLEAAQTAEVKSRVTGTLLDVRFRPGAMVKNGEVLFGIDSTLLQAELDKRVADVRLAQARLAVAAAALKEAKTPSASDRQRMEAQRVEAEAAVTAAKAALKVAQLNLDSTRLTAPVSGKISRPTISVGSLVESGKTLATIDSVDPICVAFAVDERTALELRRNHRYPEAGQPIFVGLAGENGFPHKASFESADTRVDPAMATERWRAMLPNPDGQLLPGMFVRVRLVTSDPKDALLVPETTVGSDHGGRFVFIVTDQNVVRLRDVNVGQIDDGMRVINQGLAANDWVIDQGARPNDYKPRPFLRDGMTVNPRKSLAAVPLSPPH
jgi:RND family efflux transporter MFP subunit